MGTKNNPSEFDCYANAEPDEPMFVLLGRDPVASVVVRFWVRMRQLIGDDQVEQLAEAILCAEKMQYFAVGKGKIAKVAAAQTAFMFEKHRK